MKVGIVGVAQTKHEGKKPKQIFADMIFEVVTKALEDAGLERDDIENVVTISNDFWDGRTISSMAVIFPAPQSVRYLADHRKRDLGQLETEGLEALTRNSIDTCVLQSIREGVA